jgi:hypothetical protein
MMRTALIPLTVLLLLAGAAPGANDNPLPGRDGNYEFETASLVGTVWEGKIVFDDTSIIRFDPKGVLRIHYFKQNTLQASWQQQGDKIIITINNKYVECEGFLRNGRLVGSAKNKANNNWTWEMKRKPPSEGQIFGGTP